VLVVAPHPDDEVIGCGGTIMRHVRMGDAVSIVYLSSGENTASFAWMTPQQKAAQREIEALASCRILGVDTSRVHFLRGADGHLGASSELIGGLTTHIHQVKPHVIYVPHEHDGHPDHVAAYHLVAAVLRNWSSPHDIRLYAYEVWSPLYAHFGVDVTPVMSAKLQALGCHKLALSAFDYVPMVKGLAAFRSGTLLNRLGYAEAVAKVCGSVLAADLLLEIIPSAVI
jgi:LmbE family N-acetylglucosaminyl deacetylase